MHQLSPPSLVLVRLQSDLASMGKSTNLLPYARVYDLAQDARFELNLWRQDRGDFHLEISLNGEREERTDSKLKKLVDFAYLFVWRALSCYLARTDIAPSCLVAHSGADEVLALYQGLHAFKSNATLPFKVRLIGPQGPYDIFSATDKSGYCQIIIETNQIFGNSMRWTAEVEFINQALERTEKILTDLLGEWLRPGGRSLRLEFERERQIVQASASRAELKR